MRRVFVNIILLCFMITSLVSCSIRKHIPEDKMILKSNVVEIYSQDVDFTKSDISPHIIQSSNPKFLGIMPLTWLYYKTENKNSKLFQWINKTAGEKPVYFNNEMKENSVVQISKYLNDIGYFNSGISTKIKNRKGISKVYYGIYPAKPYIVDVVSYKIADSNIYKYVKEIEETLPVQKGEIYNVFKLDDERDMISEHLKNNGYFYFTKDYIFMEVDTNFNDKKANINIRIDNVLDPFTQKTVNHKQYTINDIYIYPKGTPLNNVKADTTQYTFELNKHFGDETYYFIYNGDPKIRAKTFDNIIQIQTGSLYNFHQVTQTYKALNNLKIYNLTNIDFEPVENNNDSINLLNCNIVLNRTKVNYYSLQLEGTNSSGDLGIIGSFTYRNKNIFKGSEIFNISLRAGTQAQSVLDDFGNTSLFNTREFGIDASIFFPKFLSPIKLKNFAKEYQPRTTLTVGYNLQERPIYTRQIALLTFGYNWMKNKYEQHIFTPLTLNSVKVEPTPSFEAILEQETNQRIKDQYTSHLIFGLDYTYVFNNQNVRFIKDFFYFKANIQSSGNLLSAFNNTSAIKTIDNYHEIFGIRYAQYVRFAFDFRYFKYVYGENQIATRFMLGAGIPYGNSNDMPFEKSFYAGGSNGMRGWQFRELGPGTFNNPDNLNIERIGDIQLEFNLEYRFPIHSFIKGAVFTDIGNIWTMKENETFKGGQFKFDTFYKQLAADAGIGIRFDFSFFLFRLDAATPIVNPAYPEGERWRISKLQFRDFILNFGIGYPF
ncbi:MAG: BamA/TamA family outer membrane protein [Bacteroidales bacterium]|nr:BamA/TamA family outer membrane protein [Bacteroidales bacterium]